jgi:cytosine/adenosine deaminase-related metal-dependent hydrolase
MSYQKFQAEQLFTGTEMLGSDHVLVTDEKGKVEEIIPAKDAGEGVQKLEGVLTPGFINCHCHLELSHMKGLIPERTGLVDFVFTVVTQRHFAEEEIAAAITKAEDDMLANGIVAVGDICNNLSTLPQKTKQRLAYYNFIEVSGWLPPVAETRFKRSLEFYDAFGQIQNSSRITRDKIQNSLVPHAPYSVSNELWNLMIPYFPGKTISIHNQETAFEDDLFISATGEFNRMYEMMKMDTSFFQPTGKSSLQSYFPKMNAAKNVLLVHNTFTKEEDILFVSHASSAANQNVSYCLCVNANQYIENALPPVDLFRKQNAAIVIGTDSLASNHSLSVLDELKTIAKNFPLVPLTELLQWATLNGAKALQMDDALGSFEKAKTPGVLILQELTGGNIGRQSKVKRLI